MKKVYSSHGCVMPFSEMRELEVVERENYTHEELDEWKEKYHLNEASPVMWVTTNKALAIAYSANSEDRDKILSMSDIGLMEYMHKNGISEPFMYESIDSIVITESYDGDDGFIMVF